ncbi:peptidylprolyl isomerase [Ruminococcus sp. Marseille-P6503]|uniref:peptidylprolyl isomerase n=1 Tax=Ruminococcus sp. Marseille-P6503 TaxID=2364796 RepID=UPI000F543E0B|nr:peptidylprolyl isomerase [Ruminococcus sp. Marseille-P6503]
MNGNNQINDPFRRRKTRTYFQLSLIAVIFVIVFAVIMFFAGGKEDPVDYSESDFIQLEEPADDAPVVVFETTEGTFRAVLFENEAPEYCKFFEGLVNDGYFDGTYVCTLLRSGDITGGFIGGSKTKDGMADDSTDVTMIDLEVSPNILPLNGTLGSLVKQGGTFSKSKAGSVFTVLGDAVDIEELKENTDSEDVNGFKRVSGIFEEYGGVPNYIQMYTFFGQVYDGWDVLEKINSAQIVDEDVPDDESDKNYQPASEIKFTRVYMSTYGEQNSNGYSIPVKAGASANSSEGQPDQDDGSEAADSGSSGSDS